MLSFLVSVTRFAGHYPSPMTMSWFHQTLGCHMPRARAAPSFPPRGPGRAREAGRDVRAPGVRSAWPGSRRPAAAGRSPAGLRTGGCGESRKHTHLIVIPITSFTMKRTIDERTG